MSTGSLEGYKQEGFIRVGASFTVIQYSQWLSRTEFAHPWLRQLTCLVGKSNLFRTDFYRLI